MSKSPLHNNQYRASSNKMPDLTLEVVIFQFLAVLTLEVVVFQFLAV